MSVAKIMASKNGREVEDGIWEVSATIAMDEGDEWIYGGRNIMRGALGSGIFFDGAGGAGYFGIVMASGFLQNESQCFFLVGLA